MPVNWNLFTPVDISGKFNEGWDRGQKLNKERRLNSALAAFSANPSDPAAQSALAAASPEFAMKMAASRWKEEADLREKQRIAAMFADSTGGGAAGVPAGINGKPTINWRERQAAALRMGETTAAAAMGSMADDQERRADLKQKMTIVKSESNPVTGAITYHDWQGTPIGDDQHMFVRDSEGMVHPHGWTPPPEAPAAPDGEISYGNPDDTPEQATVRAEALMAIHQGADPAAVWARAAQYGVTP